MKNNKSVLLKRNANIELLRIVAMMGIILHHIVVHCINGQLINASNAQQMSMRVFSQPKFYSQLMLLVPGTTFGPIGNNIFIIITGYFMIDKPDINLLKISKKLLFQLVFATLALVGGTFTLFLILGKKHYISLIGTNSINELSWFVGYYFIIILLARICINKYFSGMDRTKYNIAILSGIALLQFCFSINILADISSNLLVLVTGIFLYLLGGYIKKFNPLKNVKMIILILIIAIINILFEINFFNSTSNNIQNFVVISTSKSGFTQYLNNYSNNNLFIIIIAVCLFEIFNRLKINQSQIINYLGGATFMVYLIHDNNFFYNIWNSQDWITPLADNPMFFILKYVVWALITFFIGVLAYAIYEMIINRFSKM